MATSIRDIEATAGRPFDQVVATARASSNTTYQGMLAWVKTEWGLGHANHVAIKAIGKEKKPRKTEA